MNSIKNQIKLLEKSNSPEEKKSIGLLKEIALMGLTVREFAGKAEMNIASIYLIDRGKVEPQQRNKFKINRALGKDFFTIQ